MRLISLITAIVLSLSTFAQTIKSDEIDKFTGSRRVETSIVSVKRALGCNLSFAFRSVDSLYLVIVYGSGCSVGIVGSDDEYLFLLADSSVVHVQSKGIQDYEIGTGYSANYYHHEYFISKPDIEKLASRDLVSTRAYIDDGYSDTDIKSKNQGELRKLAAVFLKAIDKK